MLSVRCNLSQFHGADGAKIMSCVYLRFRACDFLKRLYITQGIRVENELIKCFGKNAIYI